VGYVSRWFVGGNPFAKCYFLGNRCLFNARDEVFVRVDAV
jgi:hypothetical protein